MSLFNFNYYYGESPAGGWIEKALPALAGVVIGFLLNRGYELYKETVAIKRAGEEFVNELELFKEPLSKQIKSLDELIVKLANPITADTNLVGSIPVDTDRIKSIDRLQVYKCFKKITGKDKKEARRVVNKLYGTLKVCSMEAERMRNLYESFTKNRRAEVKRFNHSLNELLGNFANLVVAIEKQGRPLTDDKLYSSLLPSFTLLTEKSAELNIDQIVESISKPIVHVTAEFRHDDRSIAFSSNNRNCFTCYREYLDLKNEFVSEIKNIHSNLSQLHTQMVSLLEIYGPKVLR